MMTKTQEFNIKICLVIPKEDKHVAYNYFYIVVQLVGGGSVINRAYPV